MKMYKIIPKEKRITEIDYDGTYDGMKPHLKYEWYDTCRVNEEGDYLFVNDIGLLDGTAKKDGVFWIWNTRGYWQPISGNALYWGTSLDGENANPFNTIEQLENLIRWKETEEMIVRS